jgi:tRNA-specific 2-thiouridylase
MSLKKNSKTNKKVMIALSGGIDSAVSAVLLIQQGYQVEAAFMKNWSSTTGLLRNECPWIDDRREALKVAAHLDIPMHTFDFEKEYSDKVMEYFFTEYSQGRTPNPDVMCNKEIKFKLLYQQAMKMGFDYLATGHYAQIQEGQLMRSKDEFKDQTYFIYNIKKEQLDHVLFPVGKYKKPEIRKLAAKFGLPNQNRKESMGLCFVGKIRLDEFLHQKIKPRLGNILETSGKIVGQHKGIAFYTVGQRQGLGVGGSAPYYVVRKDLKTNTLVVSHDPRDVQLQVQ